MPKGKKHLELTCPCCNTSLIVDASTGLIISNQGKSPEYSLEEAFKAETVRKKQADALFSKAFSDEEERRKSLEKRFEKALEVQDELDEPVRPWDYD